MKTIVTMNSRRFGEYEAKSYFIHVTKDKRHKLTKVCFINDNNFVETCELTIETDVLVNIATAIQSEINTSYPLNVRDGHIANQSQLSDKQRMALLETRLGFELLDEKFPLDIYDKKSGEIFYHANTKVKKASIKEIALHFNTVSVDPSPLGRSIKRIIREVMGERL